MAANSGDLEENLRINVNIHYRGILGILVKRIDTKGYLVRKVEDVSPFFTVLKIGDIITHWDKIPLHNVSFDKYNELVEVSQKNGKFALLLKRYTKQKPKDKNQETHNKDETGETQTETAPVPAPNLPSSSGVTAAGKDGNDNAVLDKIEIVSDQTMLEDTPLIQHTTDKISFYESLEELKQYEKQHGHVNVDEASNPKLYNWCVSMRSLRRFPKLQPPDAITSPETQPDNRGDGPAFNEYFIKELEELNFDWDPDKCDTHHILRREDKSNSTFNVHLEELKKFKKVHGHTNPNGKTDRAALYSWCASIRFAHRSRQRGENKGMKLDEDRIRRLEEIGFLFDTESASNRCSQEQEKHSTHAENKSNSTFNVHLEELKKFKKVHRHTNPNGKNDRALYNWCASIRFAHRSRQRGENKGIRLGEDRIHRLEQIGFLFDQETNNKDDQTETAPIPLPALDLPSPSGVTAAGKDGNDNAVLDKIEIVSNQTMLEDTPLIQHTTDKSNSTFNVHLEELKKFKKVHGHTNPNYKNDKALYSWCLSIVRSYKDMKRGEPPGLKLASKGMKLDEDRIRRLEEIGFSFVRKRKSALFDDNLHELKRYKSIHGHCNVTAKNDGRIGTWAANIRSLHRSKQRGGFSGMQLSEDRIDRLEEIGFLSDTESASNGCSQEQEEHSTHADTKAKHRLTPSQAATFKHGIIEESASPSNRHSRLKRKPVTYEEDFDDSSIDEVSGSKRRRSEWMSTRKTRNLRNTQEEKKGYEFFLNITKRTACEDEEGSAVTKWADLSIEEQTCYNELAYFEVKRLESKKSFDISGRGEKYPNFPSTEWSTLKTPALWDLPEDWKVEDGVSEPAICTNFYLVYHLIFIPTSPRMLDLHLNHQMEHHSLVTKRQQCMSNE